jgi:hypothetical protein
VLFSTGTPCNCAVGGVSACFSIWIVSWFEDSRRYAGPFSLDVDSTAVCVVELSLVKPERWGCTGFPRGACCEVWCLPPLWGFLCWWCPLGVSECRSAWKAIRRPLLFLWPNRLDGIVLVPLSVYSHVALLGG